MVSIELLRILGKDTYPQCLNRSASGYDLVLTEEDLPQLLTKVTYPYFKNFVYKWKEMCKEENFTLGKRDGSVPGRHPE